MVPAFRIHLLSGAVVTVPIGQFTSTEEVHSSLHTMDPWAPMHARGVMSASIDDALGLSLAKLSVTNEFCLSRDAVMAVEQVA